LHWNKEFKNLCLKTIREEEFLKKFENNLSKNKMKLKATEKKIFAQKLLNLFFFLPYIY
jgi:hypothetical protein